MLPDDHDNQLVALPPNPPDSAFQAILDSLPGLYYMVDDRGKLVHWNLKCIEVTGYSNEEHRQMFVFDLFDPQGASHIAERMRDVFENGEAAAEAELVTKSGRRIPYLFTGKRIIIEGRAYLSGLGSDLSEQRKREQELHQANINAEKANRAKSEFIGNMSHEIRTPLNSIIGLSTLLLNTPLDERQQDFLSKVYQSGHHLLGIVSDILDFSKIEAGQLALEETDFQLEEIMAKLNHLLANRAMEKGLKLSCVVDSRIFSVLRGDPLRLGEILINFVDNAIKYSEVGHVNITATLLEEHEDRQQIRFEVRDSGIGLSDEAQLRIFQPFQQADSSTTRKYGGTGLGLVICKRLAEMMGGTVGVQSQTGEGSTFWFTARLGRGATASKRPCSPTAACAPEDMEKIRGKRILLVEDNLFNQLVSKEFLLHAHAIVRTAENGRIALDMLDNEPFDCVLLDIQMPHMSGLEVARRIRSNPSLALLPIIAVTANALNEERERCLALGMNEFVTKPILAEVLYRALGRCLDRDATKPHQPAVAEPDEMNARAAAGQPLDLALIAEFSGGDKVLTFANKFIESCRKDMTQIRDAHQHKDAASLRQLRHHLISPATMVGAAELIGLCDELDSLARQLDMTMMEEILARIDSFLDRAEQQVVEAASLRN